MAIAKELIEFTRDDLGEVLGRLSELAGAGAGWCNVEPVVSKATLDDLRSTSPPFIVRVFSGRGSKIPFATFVPADRPGAAASAGLQHSTGPRAVARLAEAGITVPATWRRQQDHSKRGIVYAVPADESPATILAWLLDAATELAGVELTGWWSAVFARPE